MSTRKNQQANCKNTQVLPEQPWMARVFYRRAQHESEHPSDLRVMSLIIALARSFAVEASYRFDNILGTHAKVSMLIILLVAN